MSINFDVGFAFPFRFSGGRTATVGGLREEQTNEARSAAVAAGVRQVLLTGHGERVMLCGFGAGLNRWCFGALPGTEVLAQREAIGAVETWCRRARVTATAVAVNQLEGEVEVGLVVRHADSDSESIVHLNLSRS